MAAVTPNDPIPSVRAAAEALPLELQRAGEDVTGLADLWEEPTFARGAPNRRRSSRRRAGDADV